MNDSNVKARGRGFASMDSEKQRRIASLGGRAAHQQGTAHEFSSEEAREAGRSLRDHLSHMLVHGLLHLLGFDHESEDQAEEMEDFERRILARLGIEDPYSGTVPVEDLAISP